MSDAPHGLLVIDKPPGITSREVVNRVEARLPLASRIGHAGTLDPLATGVLVLCIGKATRLIEYIQAMPKTYHTFIQLGAESVTDDAEGPVTALENAPVPDAATVADCVSGFIGAIEQLPPAFSAAKISGQRAYKLARKGRDVALEARRVHIDAIRILSYDYPQLELEVECGKGTYIRSLARDIGRRLGCGGYVASLRRTRVGVFSVAAAQSLDAENKVCHAFGAMHCSDRPLSVTAPKACHPTGEFQRLWPLELAVSDLPRVTLDAHNAGRLMQGQRLPWADEASAGRDVAVFTSLARSAGEDRPTLIAVARIQAGVLKPVKVLGDA
jgi:tRNA pseudouridine55 synthase